MKRLYKSRNNKMLAGVCAGVAEYLNLDPSLVRIGFLVLSAIAGSGALMYILAAIIIPEQPVEEFRSFYQETDNNDETFYDHKHF